MAQMYYNGDCNLELLKGKTVAIIGYGSQGRSHAQNLNDSGVNIIVGLMPNSKTRNQVKEDGLTVYDTDKAAKMADIIMILTPDEIQADVYKQSIEPNLKDGDIVMFAHGFNINYSQIIPPPFVDVIMVSPKGQGRAVRSLYLEGRGVPALIAVHQNFSGKAKDYALAYAAAIGSGRIGILETTFKEETETDLFGEQAVLCGGVTELMKAAFDTLVNAGYQPEAAYFECIHELKLIVDLINEGGFSYMRHTISDTAEYGDYVTGKRIITENTREEMKNVLEEIQEGKFATNWIAENRAGGRANFLTMRRNQSEHLVETVGHKIRKMMKP